MKHLWLKEMVESIAGELDHMRTRAEILKAPTFYAYPELSELKFNQFQDSNFCSLKEASLLSPPQMPTTSDERLLLLKLSRAAGPVLFPFNGSVSGTFSKL